VDELLEAIFGILDEVRENGPTESEVSDAREALLRQFETDFSRNGTWLSQLVSDYQRGVPPGEAVETFEDTVRALSPAAVQALARRILDTQNYVRVTLMPE
jgi:predicted Zn-dependent peptidase